MSEHRIDRERPNRVPEKAKHPLGWACENCFHVVKDTRPGSSAMKCVRYPPAAQLMQVPGPGGIAWASVSPPVQEGEWCGEYYSRQNAS